MQPVYATDGEMLFRQEAYFHYLFGVNEDGFWGAVDVRDVSNAALLRCYRHCCITRTMHWKSRPCFCSSVMLNAGH